MGDITRARSPLTAGGGGRPPEAGQHGELRKAEEREEGEREVGEEIEDCGPHWCRSSEATPAR